MLGICQALGDDLGFPPNLLRIVFALGFYFSPLMVVGSYLGLGLVVALSRWVAPPRLEVVEDYAEPPEEIRLAA
jgi:phage shock protein PspC (stress-responsive transcriptional regulator)